MGLILFNSIRFNDGVRAIVGGIEGERHELYAAQYGWSEGWMYTKIPPDAMDKNAIIDAIKRSLKWLDKYGKDLPVDIFNDVCNYGTWHLTQVPNVPNEPSILFEP